MQFKTFNETPDSERPILLFIADGDNKYFIQGWYGLNEEEYFDWDGETMEDVMIWSELPIVEHI